MVVYGMDYYYPLEIKRCENGFYNREVPAVKRIQKVNKTIREGEYKFYYRGYNKFLCNTPKLYSVSGARKLAVDLYNKAKMFLYYGKNIVLNLENLIESYNSFIKNLYVKNLNKSSANISLSVIYKRKAELNHIGISINQNSTLNLNKRRFLYCLKEENHKIKNVLLGDEGIVKAVIRNASIIEKNPVILVDTPESISYNSKGIVKKYSSIFLDIKV